MKFSVKGVSSKTFGLRNTSITKEIVDHLEDMQCMVNDLDMAEESVKTTHNMVPTSVEKTDSYLVKNRILTSTKIF